MGIFNIFLISLFLICSCTTTIKENGADLKRRNVDTYYRNSGVVKYFLPDIPSWANYSTNGQCFRKTHTRYFDISAVRVSFFMSYEQAIQQQLAFNQLLSMALEPEHRKYITLTDEERYFFEASEKVQAGIRIFQKPKYKQIHVIWIDPLLKKPRKLRQLIRSKRMEAGHPVFLSMCLNRQEIVEFNRKHKLSNFNIRLISQELFSPFDHENNRLSYLGLNLSALFEKRQNIVIFIPRSNNMPQEIIGTYKTQKY